MWWRSRGKGKGGKGGGLGGGTPGGGDEGIIESLRLEDNFNTIQSIHPPTENENVFRPVVRGVRFDGRYGSLSIGNIS